MPPHALARTLLGRACIAGALAAAALTLAGCDGKNMDSMMDCPLPVVYDCSDDGASGYFVDALPDVSKNCCKTLFAGSSDRGYVSPGTFNGDRQVPISCRYSSSPLVQIWSRFDRCWNNYQRSRQWCSQWRDSRPPPVEWPEQDQPSGFLKILFKLGLGLSALSTSKIFFKLLAKICDLGDDAEFGLSMMRILATVGSYTMWFLCWLLGTADLCIDTVDSGTTNPVIKYALNPNWFPILAFVYGSGAFVTSKFQRLENIDKMNAGTPPTRAKVLSASFSGYYADAVMGSLISMNWEAPGDHFNCAVSASNDISTESLMYLSALCVVWTLYGVLYDNMKWKPCCGCDSNLACMTAAAGVFACVFRSAMTLQSLASGASLVTILTMTWLNSFTQLLEDVHSWSKVCTYRENTSARNRALVGDA